MCMYKKNMCLISVVLLLGMAGSALAIDSNWNNNGGDREWDNVNNWSAGVPTGADKAGIRHSVPDGPIIDSGTAAVANVIVLGDWSSTDTLDITGGSLTTNGWFILAYGVNDDGTFNVSGGTTTVGSHLDVGRAGTGHMNMTAGTVTVNSAFGIGATTGSGDVQLDGGTISCGSFTMTSGSSMDITNTGTLIVNGDVTSTINTYVSNGWLTANGGAGTVVINNVTNPGKTTVTANMPSELPTKATDPIPLSSATDISITPILSWLPGLNASSHDVYFGTTSPGTFQGNQTAGTFNPGVLDQDTTYYWRIDEKNAVGTATGDVWTFTTTDNISYNQTLTGKIMCGYQGWFNYPGDGAGLGWVHWGKSNRFEPGFCSVDTWPDMSEYDPDEKYATLFDYADGSPASVFSSHNQKTVVRHFSWMADYGLDGVFLQRFINGTTPGSSNRNHKDQVMLNCQTGAKQYNRVWAMMYDLSSSSTTTEIKDKVINDWIHLVDTYGITQDPTDSSYLHHEGKPIVAVWGLGFERVYEGQGTRDLIDFLKNDPVYGGCSIMIGVDNEWRTRMVTDPLFGEIVQMADIISPWAVGRYGSKNTGDLDDFTTTYTIPDKVWCDANGKDYLPVVFPGFSWQNLKGEKWDHIPRLGGRFLWRQYYKAIVEGGATMVYQAMFDEVDEGTAIFKVTNDPPVAEEPDVVPSTPFLPTGNAQYAPYDPSDADLPSDEYLWLVGQATRGLRGEIPINETRPVRTAQLPGQASNPSPADTATDVSINADLSWTAGSNTDSHDVYFGTNPTPDAGQFQGNQGSTSFDPGTLAYDTTYYWAIDETNANGTTLGPVWSFTTGTQPDTTAPTPDPMTWAIAPHATGTTSISMTATTATDISGVEYYFTCTAGGGNDSGWQAGTTYQDTSLTPNTTYTYTVTAGDLSANLNETAPSSSAAATTDVVLVTVPDVVGQAQATAESNIVAAGLVVGTVTTSYSGSVSAGDVISQSPAGSSSVVIGSSVDIEVSLGVQPVTVPDVVGQAQATAESNIITAGLVVGTVTTSYSGSVPAGDVISQNPTGGSSVPPGSSVDIEVSLGIQMVTVPDVVGQAQATAESNIIAAGLVVGTVTTSYSGSVSAGDVISQSPAGSSSVVIGSSVDLVVSLGPAPVTVPDVVGQAQATAESNIITAGLVVGTVTTESSGSVPAGDVISQNPTGGASVPPGSSVDLVVSTGPSSGDVITVLKAEYGRRKSELKVEATSSDGGNVTLTIVGYGDMTWNSRKSKYTFRKKPLADPGGSITITSTGGGSVNAAITYKR